jgi:hypothetical protein
MRDKSRDRDRVGKDVDVVSERIKAKRWRINRTSQITVSGYAISLWCFGRCWRKIPSVRRFLFSYWLITTGEKIRTRRAILTSIRYQARQIQLQRFDKSKIHANAQMGAKESKRHCAVKEDADRLLETAINKLGLSARAYSRVLKVGRTIADLAGSENVEASHIAEAILYRSLDRRM